MRLHSFISPGCFVLFLLTLSDSAADGETKNYWQQDSDLHAILLKSYNPDVRPASVQKETVYIKIFPQMVRIEDIDERQDTLTTTFVLPQSWNDPRLVWNPKEYGNITTVYLPMQKLWRPDLVMYNAVPHGSNVAQYDGSAVVTSDGSVTYVPMVTSTSYCPLELTSFPFDTQTCSLVFGSWIYSENQAKLIFWTDNITAQEKMQIDIFGENEDWEKVEHPEWTLVGGKAEGQMTSAKYECCEERYRNMKITLTLKRQRQYYRTVAVLPAVLLALLVPFQFFLPVDSSQRTSYSLLIILSQTMLIVALQDYIPFQHSSVPRIALFYVVNIGLAAMACCMSIIVLSLSRKGSKRRPLPAWLQSVCFGRRGLRRWLCFDQSSPVTNMYSSLNTRLLEDVGESPSDHSGHGGREYEPEATAREMDSYEKGSEGHLRRIDQSTRVLAGKTIADDAFEKVSGEWKDFAMIIDRLFFLVFTVMFIISACSLIIRDDK